MIRIRINADTITRELDALILLQAAEFFCHTHSSTIIIESANKFFDSLIKEFQFENVAAAEIGSDIAIDISDFFWKNRNHPRFYARFCRFLQKYIANLPKPRPYYSPIQNGEKYVFTKHNKLGDAISILAGLEAYCISNRIDKVFIGGSNNFQELLALFSFTRIEFDHASSGIAMDRIFRLARWTDPWMTRFNRALAVCANGTATPLVKMPQPHFSIPDRKADTVYVQFDARSSQQGTIQDARTAIDIICKTQRPTVLGGKDTAHYLGNEFQYELGDLPMICKRLAGAKMFLGCDSGLAHIAGNLGTPGFVINYTDLDVVRTFFSSYPSLKVLDLELLKKPAIIRRLQTIHLAKSRASYLHGNHR